MTQKRTRKIALWAGIAAAAVAVTATVLALVLLRPAQVNGMTGVVLRNDKDARKQVPVISASISAGDLSPAKATSDASGLFHIRFQPGIRVGRTITLKLLHPDYQPLQVTKSVGDELLVLYMTPVKQPAPIAKGPEVTVKAPRVRYAVTTITTSNVGSAVKVFEVTNQANVPCNAKPPCSPDGKWKATISGTTLDAGGGNQFQNARVSCIAGPCPFTKIETDHYSAGGPKISVAVRNWSDTTSFLFEAEVTRTMQSDEIRQSYPAIFGQGMNFTLPATGQGPSIEATVNGTDIVFPLGPSLKLSWATCNVQVGSDHSSLYHCDLKPGYRFE